MSYYRYERIPCKSCNGTGRLKGTRETAGRCGARRGTTLKKCTNCLGDGSLNIRLCNEEDDVVRRSWGDFREKAYR